MSTKKELLGKENRKGNGHRRYSLLLLALLFIGFASYGTYAYFSNSTETTRGQLTLNGLDSSYEVDKGGNNLHSGDGTSNIKDTPEYNNKEFIQRDSGNSTFEDVTEDHADNSTKFGEFPWVYVGNNEGNDVAKPDKLLLKQSFDLKKFNAHVLAKNTEHTEFDNVVEGDVFRKTVRLAVNGSSQVPMTAKITWKNDGESTDNESTDNIIVGAFYRKDAQENNAATEFNSTKFEPAFDENSADEKEFEKEIGTVKSGDFIDVELVVAVKNGVNKTLTSDVSLPNLAKISRRLKISLVQEKSNVLQDKTNN